jgi:hypothetical protein
MVRPHPLPELGGGSSQESASLPSTSHSTVRIKSVIKVRFSPPREQEHNEKTWGIGGLLFFVLLGPRERDD